MKKLLYILSLFLVFTSCKGVLDIEPEDQLTSSTFFKNDREVLAYTGTLYGHTWFDWQREYNYTVGDILPGNALTTNAPKRAFEEHSVTSDNRNLTTGWASLWHTIAKANALFFNLEEYEGSEVTESTDNAVRAEAYFIRALSYYYLVQAWGPVPIIEKKEIYSTSPGIFRNTEEDVYTFIKNDLNKAIELGNENWATVDAGRVTKNAARALLAKIHLTTKDYEAAAEQLKSVIESGKYGLHDDFLQNFLPEGDNGKESVFAIQWFAKGWGDSNPDQQNLTPEQSLVGGAGGGWGIYTPSIDAINLYDESDKRYRLTIMTPGEFYPELGTKEGGYTFTGKNSTNASFRKYIVGSPDEYPTEIVTSMSSNNTNIIRYSDVLLMYTEAIIGDGDSTIDAEALATYNQVRDRAGLPLATIVTKDELFLERRKEFMIEGMYFYDLKRRGSEIALREINAANRATDPDYIRGEEVPVKANDADATEEDLTLPIPQLDVDLNPNLNADPVSYNFSNN